MTSLHDHFQRSPHGGFIRSPHGHFNDEDVLPPVALTGQLLIMIFIDESGFTLDLRSGTGYVAQNPLDQNLGNWRWAVDNIFWSNITREHPVVGLVVLVTGGVDQWGLTPPGQPWPGTYITLTSAPRPIQYPLPGAIKVGLQLASDKFQGQHGQPANIERLAAWVDESGSMTRADVSPIWETMARYLGREPPNGLGVLSDSLYPPSDPADPLVGVTYYWNERWLWWMGWIAAHAFGLPAPSPWPYPPP